METFEKQNLNFARIATKMLSQTELLEAISSADALSFYRRQEKLPQPVSNLGQLLSHPQIPVIILGGIALLAAYNLMSNIPYDQLSQHLLNRSPDDLFMGLILVGCFLLLWIGLALQ